MTEKAIIIRIGINLGLTAILQVIFKGIVFPQLTIGLLSTVNDFDAFAKTRER